MSSTPPLCPSINLVKNHHTFVPPEQSRLGPRLPQKKPWKPFWPRQIRIGPLTSHHHHHHSQPASQPATFFDFSVLVLSLIPVLSPYQPYKKRNSPASR